MLFDSHWELAFHVREEGWEKGSRSVVQSFSWWGCQSPGLNVALWEVKNDRKIWTVLGIDQGCICFSWGIMYMPHILNSTPLVLSCTFPDIVHSHSGFKWTSIGSTPLCFEHRATGLKSCGKTGVPRTHFFGIKRYVLWCFYNVTLVDFFLPCTYAR